MQVSGYIHLAAAPYPAFGGADGYPVDVEIDPSPRQRRWPVAGRLVLAIPALLLAAALGGGGWSTDVSYPASGGSHPWWVAGASLGGLARQRRSSPGSPHSPAGGRRVGYATWSRTRSATGAHATGYLLLVTDRYPTSDPARVLPTAPLPRHPVTLELTDALDRSRLTVFFRLLLAVPHLIWLSLWSVIVLPATFAAWLVAIFTGRVPDALHRFIAAWVRYGLHVGAFLFLVGGPFPGFVGAAGSYPVDVAIAPPERQRRGIVLFRIWLAVPALTLAVAYSAAALLVALLGWWASLVTGRMPEGLRNLGAVSLRYSAQTNAYVFLLTDRYPYSAPAVTDPPRDEQLELRARNTGSRAGGRRARLTRAGRALVLAVALAAWLACARILLHTVVPSHLHLTAIDSDRVFGQAVVHKTIRVERFFLSTWLLGEIALFAALVLYARRGARFARESAAGPIGTGMLLGMLGLGIVWLVQLPFGLLDIWWARRHGLTKVGYLDWALGHWVELGAAFASICFALLVVMFLARRLGEIWWIPGAFVFVAVGATFAFVQPYLLTDTSALKDPELRRAATSFERAQGVSKIPISVEDVSGTTSQANAFAVGFGPSRKVVLWSTMIDGTFSDAEVRVVLAHEIGHHSSKHIPKGLAWFGLFALPCAWVLMRTTRRRGGMGEAAAVPLALLVVAVLQLALAPAEAWISRRMEAEADWKALQTTRDPAAAKGLFVGFAKTSLGNPNPPGWAHLLLDSHPTLAQRVEMAEAWRKLHRNVGG